MPTKPQNEHGTAIDKTDREESATAIMATALERDVKLSTNDANVAAISLYRAITATHHRVYDSPLRCNRCLSLTVGLQPPRDAVRGAVRRELVAETGYGIEATRRYVEVAFEALESRGKRINGELILCPECLKLTSVEIATYHANAPAVQAVAARISKRERDLAAARAMIEKEN